MLSLNRYAATMRRTSSSTATHQVEGEPSPEADVDLLKELGSRQVRTKQSPDRDAYVPPDDQATSVAAVTAARNWLRSLSEMRRANPWREQLSQAGVGAAMGTTQSAVARLESGLVDPQLSTVFRYAAACGYRLRLAWQPALEAAAPLQAHIVEGQGAEVEEFSPALSFAVSQEDLESMLGVVKESAAPITLRLAMGRAPVSSARRRSIGRASRRSASAEG
jgi:DNA-binding XRE family transcriptional regulator